MAALKTLFQGDSLTIGFTFGTYDTSRIEHSYVYLNEVEFTTTLDAGVLRCAIPSSSTKQFCGNVPVLLVIDDSVFGVRKTAIGNIYFQSTGTFSDSSVNTGYNIEVAVTIEEDSTAISVTLLEAFRGYSSYDIYVKYTTDVPIKTEEEWNDAVNAAKTAAEDAAIASAISEGLSEDYKDSALGYRNEAEGFKNTAQTQAGISTTKAVESASHAAAALISEQHSKTSEDNSKVSEQAAEGFKNTASNKATEASNSAGAALISEQHSKTSEDNAKESELAAEGFKTTASGQATIATNKAAEASGYATNAANSAAAYYVYNVTLGVPLTAGNYYTLTTAVAAVPVGVRKLGLTITFATSATTWQTYQFLGSSTTTWSTLTNWQSEAILRDARDKMIIYSNPTGLTGIAYNDAAPTPSADTKYIFTTSGDCTWISAGTMNVIKGDEVACLVDAGVRTYVFLPNPSRSKDYYGVEWNMGAASSTLTRIGNMEWHRTLPVHSMMRRCLLNDAGEVVYYLSATDSTKKIDGTNAVLDGADGQVMVEIPRFYVALEQVGDIVRIKMSLVPFPNSIEIQKMYISAYEASLQRSTSKLSSVLNLTTDYRGGNNNSTWDAASNTLLGKPATNISLTNFRAYARNRGAKWNCNPYLWQKVLWWLLRVEYANLNDQLTYNPALTAEGFRQGGLGVGVTDIDGTKWSTFNGINPVISCGATNSLGNSTGYVNYNMPAEYDAITKVVPVPSYRGIENPFGHIWKWTDGVKVKIQSDSDGGLSELYVCPNPANYQDANYNNYIKRGLLPRSNGYGGKALFGTFGEMLPVDVIGSSTTYLCDYFYTSIPAAGTEQRGLLFGGAAYDGAYAGCAYAYSIGSPADANAVIGSRLCFLNI